MGKDASDYGTGIGGTRAADMRGDIARAVVAGKCTCNAALRGQGWYE